MDHNGSSRDPQHLRKMNRKLDKCNKWYRKKHPMSRHKIYQAYNGMFYLVSQYYTASHHTQTSHWTPPKENWESSNDHGLPYGHEHAVDESNRTYYISHEDRSTQREDPTPTEGEDGPPEPRDYELSRDTQLGFGFVAGSEKPVVVRFVTEGGPSDGKLMPDDRILQINGENVEKSPREHVIELVKSCNQTMVVTVCQPYSENAGRKSALLTAAKKARLKNNPSRVRFADAVTLNGTSVISPSSHESYIPFMPNVLKVFLENGQTKSFKYDSKTCVKDVIDNLQEKLSLNCIEHFSLVLQNVKSPTQGKMSFLQEHQGLAEIAARPGSQHLKCLFRLTFVPRDSYNLVQKDSKSFEYFYMQCTNDVLQERFASELKCDIVLRLAALQIQEHCLSNNMGKVSLKLIEKETGLDKFVPESILNNMKLKDIRKMLNHYIKVNQNLALHGQKSPTVLQVKMHYLKMLSETRSFGGKCFLVTLVEKNAEVMISVGPRQGISLVTNIKNNTIPVDDEDFKLAPLADFDQVKQMEVKDEERQTVKRVVLHMDGADLKVMSLVMLAEETVDFISLVEGYYRVYVDKQKVLLVGDRQTTEEDSQTPTYEGEHHVTPASWSYADNQTSKTDQDHTKVVEEVKKVDEDLQRDRKVIDLSKGPPDYKDSVQQTGDARKKLMLEVESRCAVPNIKLKAPLASPDYSSVSNSSESPENQQNSEKVDVKTLSKVNESIDPAPDHMVNGHIESEDENEGFLSDDFGSTLDSSFGADFLKDSIAIASNRLNKERLNNNNDIITDTESYSENQSCNSGDYIRLNSDLHNGPICDEHLDSKNGVVPRDSLELSTTTVDQGSVSSSENTEEGSTSTGSTVVVLREKKQGPPVNNGDDHADVTNSGGKDGEYQVVMRPKSTTSTRRERPGSFGLHSPDKVPQTDEEIQELTKQYQEIRKVDRSSSSSDVHPSYNPKLFCDGGLYLDPDIIDLTFLPPLFKDVDADDDDENLTDGQTDDENAVEADTPETLMDFSSPEMACPPPGFGDRQSRSSVTMETKVHDTSMESGSGSESSIPQFISDLPPTIKDRIDSLVANDLEIGTQFSAIDALLLDDMLREEAEKESGIESESDPEFNEYSAKTPTSPSEVVRRKKKKNMNTRDVFSQLAKRQSFQHVDFGADDIDAFIASVTVPPPPKDDPEGFPLPTLVDPPKPKLSLTTDRSSSVRKSLQFGSDKSGQGNRASPMKAEAKDEKKVDEPGLDKWFAKHDMDMADLEEDIAKLIMPPPMSQSIELDVGDINIVPPVVSGDRSAKSPSKKGNMPPPPLSEKPKHGSYQVNDRSPGDTQAMTQKSEKREGVAHSITTPKKINSPSVIGSSPDKSTTKRDNAAASPEIVVKPRTAQPHISSKISEVKRKLEGVIGSGQEHNTKADKSEVSNLTGQMLQRSASHDPNAQTPSNKDKYEGIRGHLVKQLSANIHGRNSPTFEQSSSPKTAEDSPKEGTPHSVVVMREKERESSRSPGPQRRKIASEGGERLSGSPKSGRRNRPVGAPPSPPISQGLPYKRSVSTSEAVNNLQKGKAPPPAPPKRFSSLDASTAASPSSENSKAVIIIPKENILSTSSVNSHGLQKTTIGGRVKDDGMVSKSLDNSPLHVPIRVVHSIGTMPRFRKKPPMPPPRRSSALDSQYSEMPELTRSSEFIVQERPKFSTFGPATGREVGGGSRSQSNSESSIFTMFRDKPMSSPQTKEHSTLNKPSAKLAKMSAGKTISDSSYFNKHTADMETTRQSRRDSDSSDSLPGSPKTSRSKTYVSPSIQAKQNAIATALHRQTSLGGDIAEESGINPVHDALKQTDTPPRSPGVGRSSTFSKSSTIPKPYVSPQSSPALHRHSSFSKAADKNPTPFKTFLGDSVDGNKENGTKVDSHGSKMKHGARIQTKENGVKSVPLKAVRPQGASPQSSPSHSSGSPRSSAINGESPSHTRASYSPSSTPWQRSREGSTSSQDSNVVAISTSNPQSPRNSAGSAMAPMMSSPRSAEATNKITSQRRFFPARKAPAAPVPAAAPEAPVVGETGRAATNHVGTTKTFSTFTSPGGSTPHGSQHATTPATNKVSGKVAGQMVATELERRLSSDSTHSTSRRSMSPRNGTEVVASGQEKGQGHGRVTSGVQNTPYTTANHNGKPGRLSNEGLKQTLNETLERSQPGANNNDAMTSSAIDASQYTITQHSQQCDIPDEIIAKHYEGPRTFSQACLDVDALTQYLDRSISNLVNLEENAPDFRTNKDLLVAESRQFVTDSKLLVSSATQNLDRVVQNVNSSIKTLAKIVYHCSRSMNSLAGIVRASDLGSKVREVALAYKCTVESAHMAAGKPLSDPHMKSLMKQATGLAAILSVLMKALKSLDTR